MKLIDENLIDIVPKSEQNGAGPKFWGWIIPDQLCLVNIEKAANIHDCHYFIIKEVYRYEFTYLHCSDRYGSKYWDDVEAYRDNTSFWASLKSKKTAIKYANETFYKNLKIINKENSPTRLGYYMRKPVLWAYYKAVTIFGGKFC